MIPVLTATRHVLPFGELPPDAFERLVCWLLVKDANRGVDHVGAAGRDDGVDLVAHRVTEHGEELIYVQCKRVARFAPAQFEAAVNKVRDSVAAGHYEKPARLLFAVTIEPSISARQRCEKACLQAGFGCEFLTLHELDRRVKQFPSALREFFGVAPDTSLGSAVDSMRPPPRVFVDRESAHARLTRYWQAADSQRRSVVVVVSGVGGVGKSTLVRVWVHRNRERFSGCFEVTLARLADGSADMPGAVSKVLADLGIPRQLQPTEYAAKVREYHRIVDSQPIALLIEGARAESEVTVFVPASAGSMVAVTSAGRIDSLLASGAHSIAATPLAAESAAELVATITEAGEQGAVGIGELVEACGGLPLFLGTCAAWFVGRSGPAAERLARRIRSGDPSLRAKLPFAALDESYLALDDELRDAYRRLLGGPLATLTGFAAAALLGIGTCAAEAICDALATRGFLEETGAAVWCAHELLREHARRQIGDGADDAWLRELARRYAWAASKADRAIVADRPRLALSVEAAGEPAGNKIATIEDAHAWWMQERANALKVAELCETNGWHAELMLLAEGSWPMAATLKTLPEWEGIQRLAVRAATQLHDDRAEARFRSQLARAYSDSGRAHEAAVESVAAIDTARRSGDALMIASVTEFDGICRLEAGAAGAALDSFDSARQGFSLLGVERGVALQDYYASRALLSLERPAEALLRATAAYDAFVMSADEVSVVRTQLRQAEAQLAMDRAEEAADAAYRALTTATANAHWFEAAEAHDVLAECAGPDDDRARAHRAAAMDLYRRIGHPRGLG